MDGHSRDPQVSLGGTTRSARTQTARRIAGLALSLALALSGCTTGQITVGEQYELSQLRVVFLEEKQIREKWEELSGKSASMMTPRLVMESARRPEVILGFYDFGTHTIYCPKMNFEVCGHELHHALLGRFHLEQGDAR
jgi:hypothetical protein